MQPTVGDLAEFRAWTHTAPWVTAKRGAPHQYVVRGKHVTDEELWLRLVKMIRRYGEPGKFHRSILIYWIVDGHRYWTMGPAWGADKARQALILNRAPAGDTYGVQDAPHTASPVASAYDWLATDYDARYDTPTCQAENERVAARLGELAPDPVRVLDVGAGTGLLLDLKCLKLTGYTAVDPSQAMLNELIRKHPRIRDVIPSRLEEANLDGAAYGLITALFGAASYCTPEAILDLPRHLAPGGRMLLMFYEPGYVPDYYTGSPRVWEESLTAALDTFRGVSRLGRFVMVEQ